MNERIRELAVDCAGQMEWDAPKNPESFTFNRDELQKFAELIIKDQQREWVGLTDEEINSWDLPVLPTLAVFVRFLEAKLKKKNNAT
jgi:hypothetical protein